MSTFDNVAPEDVGMDLQVYVNAIIMGSFLSQLVIVIQFLGDMHLMTILMKSLAGFSLAMGTLTALLAFLGNVQYCEPLESTACFIFVFSKLASWITFALRIWALSRKDMYIGGLVSVLVALAFVGNAGSCGISTYVRALPRLCAPRLKPDLAWFNVFYSATVPIMCFSFIGLHIYYLRKHYANSTMFTTSMQANKLTATLKLFGNSIGVLLVDGITHAFRDYCSKQGPVYFFALVFGGQIIKDFIYCGYMKQFANELRKLRNPDTSLGQSTGAYTTAKAKSEVALARKATTATNRSEASDLPGMSQIAKFKENGGNAYHSGGFGNGPTVPEKSQDMS